MLTVVAWDYLFWVALRVCNISGLSGLSFPRYRLRAPRETRARRPSMNRVKVVAFDSRKYQFSFTAKTPLTPLLKSLFKKGRPFLLLLASSVEHSGTVLYKQ